LSSLSASFERVLLRLGVGDHRAELVDPKRVAVAAHPQLGEEHRPAAVQADRHGDHGDHGGEQEKPDGGAGEIEAALQRCG
jgi:hypothetical protein